MDGDAAFPLALLNSNVVAVRLVRLLDTAYGASKEWVLVCLMSKTRCSADRRACVHGSDARVDQRVTSYSDWANEPIEVLRRACPIDPWK